jgi:amino acid adenylation domain-containing protein
MIPFSHTGLQNIKKMCDAAKDACSFQNLLVIQPEADEDNAQSVFRNHETVTTVDHLKGFGLVVECALGNGTISFSAHHDSSVIMGAQVKRLLRQFEQVILELCGNARTVRDIEMFSENDRKDVMTWNSNQPMDINRCAHNIISEQAQLTPTAPAIETREASISYKDLEDLTSDLAHRLQSLGVGPDTIIPICLEKSNNGILAMVGIQKAGGAFVSLNPTDPPERLAGLIEQVNARAVIFSEQTAHLIPNIAPDKQTITMPASLKTWGPLNTAPILSAVQPHNLAYALFTSGSTGKPKAVELPHRSVSSSVMGHAIAMGYLPGQGRRVLQFTSYTFDPCIIEIFTTLTHGGCICVPAENERINSLTKFVNDFQCDYVIFTPSLVRALNPDDMPTVKTVVLGGEPMTKEIMEIWGDRVHLINAYGPTETAIVCTSRTVCGPKTVADSDRRHRPENIGRPVNSMNWVVDPLDYNRLVPVGCVGELAVTGPILAKGYMNNEEKTNEVFVRDASWLHKFGLARQRLYRTGDLVRQDPADGSLVYVARKDNQTKVNGQRLELGEFVSIM